MRELRASFLLPIALGLTILLVGAIIAVLAPWSFEISIATFVGLGLLAYLIYYTRGSSWRLRIIAIVLAIPALVGITLGLTSGSMGDLMLGVGITILLLVLHRFFTTPISYRFATRAFSAGDLDEALDLVNKSIAARPNFWESYQLRALIYLSLLNFNMAERDARKALALKPNAHPVLNTLGQVYLAEERFAEAEGAYEQALELAPQYALYEYHLGLSQYRQEKFAQAAEAFAAATQGTLPLEEYDLQATYYLALCLEATGRTEAAQQAMYELRHFRSSIKPLQKRLANQDDYPHLARMRADADGIERQLEALPAATAVSDKS